MDGGVYVMLWCCMVDTEKDSLLTHFTVGSSVCCTKFITGMKGRNQKSFLALGFPGANVYKIFLFFLWFWRCNQF